MGIRFQSLRYPSNWQGKDDSGNEIGTTSRTETFSPSGAAGACITRIFTGLRKPSRNLRYISQSFYLFYFLFFIFSVSAKVLSVNPMLSGVFVHRVFFAYFVRFEGAGVMLRFLWCTQENI